MMTTNPKKKTRLLRILFQVCNMLRFLKFAYNGDIQVLPNFGINNHVYITWSLKMGKTRDYHIWRSVEIVS